MRESRVLKSFAHVEKIHIFLFCCAFFLSLHIYANFAQVVKRYGRKFLGIVELRRLIKILAIFLLCVVQIPLMVFAQDESSLQDAEENPVAAEEPVNKKKQREEQKNDRRRAQLEAIQRSRQAANIQQTPEKKEEESPTYASEAERIRAEREANVKRIREENARRSEALKEQQREREEQLKQHREEQKRLAAEKLEQQRQEREFRKQKEREKEAELKEKWAEKKREENEIRAAKLQKEKERKAAIKEREAQKKAAEMEAKQREREKRMALEQKQREIKAREAEKEAERRAKMAEIRQQKIQKQQEERQRKIDKMAEQREKHRQRQEQEMLNRQKKREEEARRREEIEIQKQKHAELKAKRDSVQAARKVAEAEMLKKQERNMLEAKKQEEAIKEARKQAEKIYKNKSKIQKAQDKALADEEDRRQKEFDRAAQDSADYALAKAIAEGDSTAMVGVSAKRLKKLPQVVAKHPDNGELSEETPLQEPEEKVDPTRATIEAVLQRRKKAAQKAVAEAARADSIARAAAADTTAGANENPYESSPSAENEKSGNAREMNADSLNNEEFIEGEDSIDIDDLRAYALQDSSLLAQQLAELEQEMQNIADLKAAEKAQKEGKSEEIVIKVKIPKCRYLNEVHYERDKFRFIYDYDFFLYYWHQRYFHKKKFYNINDSTRVVAQYLMEQVGNTKYRRVLFNTVVDSVSHLLPEEYGPIDTLVDSIMTELNLEYLSTGEIKVFYKNRRQRKIVAKVRPTGEYYQPIGNIKFYTSNRRKIIEELDGSPYDSLIAAMQDTVDENIEFLTDSLERLKMAIDASSLVLDSLEVESDREHEARKLREKERQRQELQERIDRATRKKLEEEQRKEEEERLRKEEEERLRQEESKRHRFPLFPTVTSNSDAEAAPTVLTPQVDEDDAEITDDEDDDSISKKRKRSRRSRKKVEDDDDDSSGDDSEE